MTAVAQQPNQPVGFPGIDAKRWHGWGNYTLGPTFDIRQRRCFYAMNGEDA